MSIWGALPNDKMGTAVAAGDFNGDGHPDVAVVEGNGVSYVHLYLGPFALPLSLDRAVTNPTSSIEAEPGYVLMDSMTAASVDDDGFLDLIVTFSDPLTRGWVAVFRGRPVWPSVVQQADADWVFKGAEDDDGMWDAVVGDLNGDGASDLVLFAHNASGLNNERYASGEGYVFFGPSSRWPRVTDLATDQPDSVIYGADGMGNRNPSAFGDPLGDIIAVNQAVLVADVLDDPTPDLILGAAGGYGRTNTQGSLGEVYVLRGRPVWPAIVDLRFPDPLDLLVYGPSTGSFLHRPGAADLDGDGKMDLVLGAPFATQGTGRFGSGAIFLFRGRDGLRGTIDLATTAADATIVGANDYAVLGTQIVTGDVNGDGYGDIITAGYQDSPSGRLGAGTISVISGCAGFPRSRDLAIEPADLTIIGADRSDALGTALAVTDIDRDGKVDIVSGALYASSLGSARAPYAGEVHVILGRPFDPVCAITPEPGPPRDVCGLSDVPLDGGATTVTGCSVASEYRWLEGPTEIRGWSSDPTTVVRPTATSTYRLEVRCGDCAGPCFAAATVLITVDPDITPPPLGNSLRAVRNGGDVAMLWDTLPEARTYSLFRDLAKDVRLPAPIVDNLTGLTVSLPDVTAPPNALEYYYRVVGASCSGTEGP